MTRRFFLLFVLAFIGAANAAPAEVYGQWSRFVPASGRATAEVMALDVPADISEISLRIERAAQANPDWFRRYAAAAEPGKPLPYHENMGISEDDYARLLGGANELVLTKAGEVDIVFTAADGIVTLRGLPMTPPNDTLVFVPARNVVLSAYGELSGRGEFDQNNPAMPEGQWDGLRWQLEHKTYATDSAVVKLAMGELENQTLRMIYFEVDSMRGGIADQFHYVLLYDGE